MDQRKITRIRRGTSCAEQNSITLGNPLRKDEGFEKVTVVITVINRSDGDIVLEQARMDGDCKRSQTWQKRMCTTTIYAVAAEYGYQFELQAASTLRRSPTPSS